MKLAGRILMLVVGVGLITFGILNLTNIIDFFTFFEFDDIKDIFSSGDARQIIEELLLLLKYVFYIFFGISAVFSFINGKASYKHIIYSVLFIGLAVYTVIINGSFEMVELLRITFLAIPALYLTASILLLLGNKK